jgi:glycine dehydrogenase subunit 1
MPYLVHSDEERREMLGALGATSVEDLLVDVPSQLRPDRVQLPDGLSEMEAMAEVRRLASLNQAYEDRFCFRGGGVYRRFVPSAVEAVISKPEFYTAYTPYQPEASQGTLQAIFEYQTLIAELTGLDVANASLYDGATAVAEAAMMAVVQTGRHEVAVIPHMHPEYLEVLRCYAKGRGFAVSEDLGSVGGQTAAVVLQQPDFLGLLVEAPDLVRGAHAAGALAIACVDPISLALLAPPGEYGADIAVGEGQQLGLAPSLGGPHLGFIACREGLTRRLPGRLVGQARDGQGRRGFVLTLTAREQHIRRAKATSNICTNHSLCALAASVYLTCMGPDGLRQVAEVGVDRAHALAERLAELPQLELAFPQRPFFNEFPLRVPTLLRPRLERRLKEAGILGGLWMGRWYGDLEEVVTFCCTEVNDPGAIDRLVEQVAAEVDGVR